MSKNYLGKSTIDFSEIETPGLQINTFLTSVASPDRLLKRSKTFGSKPPPPTSETKEFLSKLDYKQLTPEHFE